MLIKWSGDLLIHFSIENSTIECNYNPMGVGVEARIFFNQYILASGPTIGNCRL